MQYKWELDTDVEYIERKIAKMEGRNLDKWLKEAGRDDKKIVTLLKIPIDSIKKLFTMGGDTDGKQETSGKKEGSS